MQEIWNLIYELAVYENAPEECVITVPQLQEDYKNRHFFAYIATFNDETVGMALGYQVYSTWKGMSMYLEDIVVKQNFRRTGIGKLLFEQVILHAREKKAGKLVWQVLDWNTPAIEFYKKFNVVFDKEWLTCKLTKEQIEGF